MLSMKNTISTGMVLNISRLFTLLCTLNRTMNKDNIPIEVSNGGLLIKQKQK